MSMIKTALITGASGGLGYEFAKIFAARKCDLVLVARSKEKLDEIKALLTCSETICAAAAREKSSTWLP